MFEVGSGLVGLFVCLFVNVQIEFTATTWQAARNNKTRCLQDFVSYKSNGKLQEKEGKTGGSQDFKYCCLAMYNLNFGSVGCVFIEGNSEREKEDSRIEKTLENFFKIRLLTR